LYKRCTGLDVHKDMVMACARVRGRGNRVTYEVAEFTTTTAGLLALAEWLSEREVTHVAMEATGVYWKPVWHVLEDTFTLVLANAGHIKNVPGRKSDVNDATWISDLLAHGLISNSFVPPRPVQELRGLTRTRKQLSRQAAKHVLRIQKTLEDANVKLSSVLSDTVGQSGQRILNAIIEGCCFPRSSVIPGYSRPGHDVDQYAASNRWNILPLGRWRTTREAERAGCLAAGVVAPVVQRGGEGGIAS